MRLKAAIDRVAKVCPRKKELAAYQAIRFVPNPGGSPYLYATDGSRISLVRVDAESVPDLLLPVGPLVTAAKGIDDLELVELGYNTVELRAGSSCYQLKGLDPATFPGLPPVPAQSQFASVSEQDWAMVSKVFHAAGKETHAPDVAVVHFTPGYVEATDQARMARVEVAGLWQGLVPASVFKAWPKGKVLTAFTPHHAFFWIGEELRAAVLARDGKYPKTDRVLPRQHSGPFVLVETENFRSVVRQAAAVSDLGLVLVEMGQQALTLTLRAWRETAWDSDKAGPTKEVPGYAGCVPVLDGRIAEPGTTPGTMLLTGKYLEEALRQVATPNVRVCYGSISDPLRIESGPYTACVWQMVYGT